jgi:CRP/FNR family transcriptional regulator, cyclic AMP receptor protein
MTQTLKPLLRGHPFLAGLPPRYLTALAKCADDQDFSEGQFLFREGTVSEAFYLIREGAVSLEIAPPGSGAVVVQTLGPGDVAGFSWLSTPNRWEFDGRAVEGVATLRLDTMRLHGEFEGDPRLGYELMRRFAALAADRLQASRLQLLDVDSARNA